MATAFAKKIVFSCLYLLLSLHAPEPLEHLLGCIYAFITTWETKRLVHALMNFTEVMSVMFPHYCSCN